MTARVVILLGPPGAGKGTQAARLSAQLKLPHVSTGDLFRENLSQGTALGKRAKAYMDAGVLVPDEVVLEMLAERVARPDCARGYLLDGFPRTLPQAESLARRLDGRAEVSVLNLSVPDRSVLERLVGRQTCRKCSNAHHVRFAPPKVIGRCDKCGGELYVRKDDSLEVVEKRLAVYREQTQPLEAWYRTRGTLRDVDGDRAPDQVFQALKHAAEKVEA